MTQKASPVCIAGMHRSGTSMVAQLLAKCGLYLGRQEDILGPAADNQDGFWENVRFVKLNDELLARLQGAWDLPPQLQKGWELGPGMAQVKEAAHNLVSTFQGHEPWGWKDPRNSITAPFWESVIGAGRTRYVHCVRHPLEVAQSIQKRSGNSLAFGLNLWLAYNKALIENIGREERIVTHYDSYYADPEAELRRVLDFLDMKAGEEHVQQACSKISRSLRHHTLNQDAFVKAGAPKQLIGLYEVLCGQAGPVFSRDLPVAQSGPAQPHQAPSVSAGVHASASHPQTIRKSLVSIVILTYNQLKFTQECIDSIQRFTPEPHELIFVDNGSTDGTVKWLRTLAQQRPDCRIIENPTNLGFARGCNQGITAASGENILLLNNDVVVTAGWLSGLLECLAAEPGIGIVGPMTNNISGTQRDPYATYTTMKDMHEYAKDFRTRHRNRRIPLRRIVGFCMLFRRELVDRIGMLDESFGTGNFEDDDFCLRASLEGYRNMIAGDVFIHHYGSRTFLGNKIDYGSTLSGHRKIFNEKWRIPAESDLGKRLLVSSALEQADELNQAGETDKAVERLLEGIQQAPDHPAIYRAMARILIDAKQFQDGLDALKSAPTAGQDDVAMVLLTGYAKEGLDLDKEAENCADAALAKEPSRSSALNLKGMLCYKRGDRPAAETFFRRATEADPGYGEPYTNLGVMKWARGDKEGGLALLERGFILSPCIMDIAVMYHTAITEMNAFARAERIFREAQALNLQNQRIAFLLIDVLLKQGGDDAAMSAIEEAMTVFTISDGLLAAALAVRDKVGAKGIGKDAKKKGALSVSMIVKNEEKHIAKCLMSVRPVADEMIVVDTGSTDRTRDIARALGAKVFEFPWTGDFSEARNFSLSKAAGTWLLSLDADEVISAKDHTGLRELVEKSAPAAYKIITRNYSTQVGAQGFTANTGEYPAEEAGLGWFPSTKARLFPNHKKIAFENPVHEFVERTVAAAGLPLLSCAIPVHHYGRLNMEKVKAKGEAYYELGKKKLAEKGENDLRALYELGVQAGELKKFDEAAQFFEKLTELEPSYPSALFNLGFAYMELHRNPEALHYSKLAYEAEPAKKECAVNYAHCELIAGNAALAAPMLETTLKSTPEYPPALAILAAAYAVLGQKDEGARIIEDLKRNQFDCTTCLHELADGLVQGGKPRQAMSVYELIVRTKQLTADTRGLVDECYRQVSGGEEKSAPTAAPTGGLNPYERQLTEEEIKRKAHRSFVGGMWEEIGRLQFDFLKEQGLRPHHQFIDVGCGSFRGGIHYVRYLDKGRYHGIDINASLVEAGKGELRDAGLLAKNPQILVNDKFEMTRFGAAFDYGIAVSVFTHLPMNHIILCLSEMRKVLKPGGVFFATFFQAPAKAFTRNITHQPGGVVTTYDADPFHYSLEEFEWMAQATRLKAQLVDRWDHPRNQKMLSFTIIE